MTQPPTCLGNQRYFAGEMQHLEDHEHGLEEVLIEESVSEQSTCAVCVYFCVKYQLVPVRNLNMFYYLNFCAQC